MVKKLFGNDIVGRSGKYLIKCRNYNKEYIHTYTPNQSQFIEEGCSKRVFARGQRHKFAVLLYWVLVLVLVLVLARKYLLPSKFSKV